MKIWYCKTCSGGGEYVDSYAHYCSCGCDVVVTDTDDKEKMRIMAEFIDEQFGVDAHCVNCTNTCMPPPGESTELCELHEFEAATAIAREVLGK